VHEDPLKPSDPSYKGSKYNVMIEWENGEVTSEPSPSLPLMTLSPVQFMPKNMTYLIMTAGNSSRALQDETRSSSTWLTKPSSGLTTWHCTTSMAMKSPRITTMPSSLTRAMETPSGKTPLPLRCHNFMSTRPLRTWVKEENHWKVTGRYAFTLSLM